MQKFLLLFIVFIKISYANVTIEKLGEPVNIQANNKMSAKTFEINSLKPDTPYRLSLAIKKNSPNKASYANLYSQLNKEQVTKFKIKFHHYVSRLGAEQNDTNKWINISQDFIIPKASPFNEKLKISFYNNYTDDRSLSSFKNIKIEEISAQKFNLAPVSMQKEFKLQGNEKFNTLQFNLQLDTNMTYNLEYQVLKKTKNVKETAFLYIELFEKLSKTALNSIIKEDLSAKKLTKINEWQTVKGQFSISPKEGTNLADLKFYIYNKYSKKSNFIKVKNIKITPVNKVKNL